MPFIAEPEHLTTICDQLTRLYNARGPLPADPDDAAKRLQIDIKLLLEIDEIRRCYASEPA